MKVVASEFEIKIGMLKKAVRAVTFRGMIVFLQNWALVKLSNRTVAVIKQEGILCV